MRLTKIQHGNIPILLTQTQINHLNKAIRPGKGADLKLLQSQVREMKKVGGIIPLLLAAIPGLIAAEKAAALGGLAGAAGFGAKELIKKVSVRGLRLGPSKKR